jgi:hypothetical protein
MMASFMPWLEVSRWLIRVVLPLPKKPVITVTGTRGSTAAA